MIWTDGDGKIRQYPPADHKPSNRPREIATSPNSPNVVRAGKPRAHPEGISINVFRDTLVGSTLLCTVYGGSEEEARLRAQIAATAFADYYQMQVRV